MEFWWFFKIPFAIYCIIMAVLLLLSPFGFVLALIVTLPFVASWWFFIREVCRSIEKSKKFNHRK